ncbi:MAG: histidine phosphatase family protein [Candidatus Lokiarchaeota archaeon]|nr:histidine phosphatase family protein [Candidatus Lokiarchaeota archaeon]
MYISIVRHGTTTWNSLKKIQGQADPPLNEEGIEQAKRLGEQLKNTSESYDIIFSSYRKRAKMTAELICGDQNKTILYNKLLNSRNVGIFSGMTLDEIKEKFPEDYEKWIRGDPDFCPPGGESTEKLAKRCEDFITFIKETYPKDSKLLVVTHRENLALLAYYITGERIIDALRRVKNCTLYMYELK